MDARHGAPLTGRMNAIHQWVSGFVRGDAISNEAMALRAMFRSWGAASEIYCEHRRTFPEHRADIRDLARAGSEIRPDDIVILHLSVGSLANQRFAELRARRALIYHNITPPHYFKGIREETARALALGREQMARLSGAAELVLADSAFNAAELAELGYANPRVFPLVFDYAAWGRPPSNRGARRGRPRTGNPLRVLFVGRGVPNKRIEDLLATHYYLRRYHDPQAELKHVGSYNGLELYRGLLETRLRHWDLKGVEFTGPVIQAALNQAYRDADVFLCLSEHEGFCAPLLEAMHHEVPVVAFAAAAVPETLDGAGVLVREKRFDLLAAVVARVGRDPELREGILAAQRSRMDRYRGRNPESELRALLQPLLTRSN